MKRYIMIAVTFLLLFPAFCAVDAMALCVNLNKAKAMEP